MAYCAKCYLCNTLYLKGSWWGLLSLLFSRQLGMVCCLMRHQMLPRAVHFVLMPVPQILRSFSLMVLLCTWLPSSYCCVSKCKMSLGSECFWMCYYPPETLRWETVLIDERLHDCAHSSEAFWSQSIFINGDDMCSSPAHAHTWTTRKFKHARYAMPVIIN